MAGQRAGTGQAFQRKRHRAWITELSGGSEAVEVQRLCRGGVASLLGDEAELGQAQRRRHARREVYRAASLQHAAQVRLGGVQPTFPRSEEHTSELQSRENLVCRLL